MNLPTRLETRRLLVAVAGAAMLTFVALVHAPALRAGFVWDDHVLAERDASFRPVPIGKLFVSRFWPEGTLADPRVAYYRPLVLLSLRFDAALGGEPAQYHATNILLHLIATGLLVATAVRLGARSSAAVLAGLVWGVAPRLTESVTWISGRTDIVACVFGLGALSVAPSPRSSVGGRWTRAPLAGLLLLSSLLSKELGVAFAAALAVLILRRGDGRTLTARGRELLVSVIVPLIAYCTLRTVALGDQSGVGRELGFQLRAATVLETTGRYVEMVFDVLRPRTSIGYLGEIDATRALVGALALVTSTALLIVNRKRLSAGSAVAITLGAVALALVVHVIPLTLSGAVAADRLLYVPLAALAIGVAIGFREVRVSARMATALSTVVLTIACAVATKRRIDDYRNEALFWIVAAETAHGHNTMPRSALAGVVRDAGFPELACRLFETSGRILETSGRTGSTAHRRTHENLAACWARIGRYEDAARLAEQLAREHPDVARVQLGLGFARLHVLQLDGARQAFERALELERKLSPTVAPALQQLPIVRTEMTRFADEAEQRADPEGFARYLARIGHLPEAVRAHVAVAENPRKSPSVRRLALSFIAEHGPMETVESVVRTTAVIPQVELTDVPEHIAERRATHARVKPFLARIEALVSTR